jgi:glycerol uptake facilitator-like aquaporin
MIRDGKKYAAKFIGTFRLVFAGTEAIIKRFLPARSVAHR